MLSYGKRIELDLKKKKNSCYVNWKRERKNWKDIWNTYGIIFGKVTIFHHVLSIRNNCYCLTIELGLLLKLLVNFFLYNFDLHCVQGLAKALDAARQLKFCILIQMTMDYLNYDKEIFICRKYIYFYLKIYGFSYKFVNHFKELKFFFIVLWKRIWCLGIRIIFLLNLDFK